MFSEKTLAAVITICVTVVAVAAVAQISRSRADIERPLTVVPRPQAEVSIPEPSFYDDFASDGSLDDSVPVEAGVPKPIASAPVVRPTSGIPGLTALAFIVGDVDTGEIYIEFNSKKALPVASMSKLVTAFVATDMLSNDAPVEISSSSVMAPPDKSNLQFGEKYALSEILYPLLLDSSNVAAEAISSSTDDRDAFMESMRSYAWEIGMPDSFFADPSGVSPRNRATGRDLFALARYLIEYRPDILALTRVASTSVATTTEHGRHDFVSIHPFVTDTRFIGGKTGRTPEAGETMMTLMDMGEKKMVVIVLASLNRQNDTRILLERVEGMLGLPPTSASTSSSSGR